MIAAVSTHPVQYHAPVFRELARRHRIPPVVVYLSDLSVRRFQEPDFGAAIDWGVDLLAGCDSTFLRKNDSRHASSLNGPAPELAPALDQLNPDALLLPGYDVLLCHTAMQMAGQEAPPFALGFMGAGMNHRRIGLLLLFHSAETAKMPAATPSGTDSP